METKGSTPTPTSRMSGFKVPKPSAAGVAPTPPARVAVQPAMPAPTPPAAPRHVMDTPAARAAGDAPEYVAAEQEAPAASAPASEQPAPADGEPAPLTYSQRIEKMGMTIDQAMDIVDAIATGNGYKETVKVSRGVEAVFTLRSTRFNSYLSRIIDQADPRKIAYMNQLMSEHQLAASLVSYAGAGLAPVDDDQSQEDWERALASRVEFVKQLPGPLFLTLCARLTDFDGKMLVIFSKGYDEYF